MHAALRERLGDHVRQAGSAVQPDKLRFDFTHGAAMSAEEVRDVEDRVNEWIVARQPVRALTTTLDEAKRLGAMALFGEKYGDVVRMVEIGDGNWSRELCGGTHVRSTAEIGVFKILAETSSAANVRRIEAITGPVAIEELRRRDRFLEAAASALRAPADRVPEVVAEREAERRVLRKQAERGGPSGGEGEAGELAAKLAARAEAIDAATVVLASAEGVDAKGLLPLADQVKSRLGENAAVVLTDGERDRLVVSVTKALASRGVHAGDVVRAATAAGGGRGGGRDTMAQAGGLDPARGDELFAAAREAIAAALNG